MKVKQSKKADTSDKANFAELARRLQPYPMAGPDETIGYHDVLNLKRKVDLQEMTIQRLSRQMDLLLEALGAEYVASETIPEKYVIKR